jgi:penicillin-binding protein 2
MAHHGMKFPWLTPKYVTEASLSFTFTRRAMVLGGLQGGIATLLAVRMGWISVAENEKYSLLSESNRVNLTLIPPRRGWIIDRYGKPLANNRSDFRVDIIPDRLRDKNQTLATLTKLLSLPPDQVDHIKEELENAQGFQPVQVAANLSYDQYAAVSVRLPDLPGVAPAQGYSRHYPAGSSVGHLLGYVGVASAKEYEERKDPLLITPGFKIGKEGLERSFEEQLTGLPGAKRVEVTASGRIVRELTTRSDTPGKSLQLTIDAGLQEYAGRRIGPESASVVVLDCATGDVLCSASMPSFDPNSFSSGISHMEWDMLSNDDHVPLRNKTLQGLYPPGSTVKPMVALSFLEAGLDPNESCTCTGAMRVGNTLFHCWKRHGHGTIDMHRAIEQSCDIYFYTFAQRMGIDVIAQMAKRLGLGQRFDLPFASQSYGTVPDPEWKMKKYGKQWETYDTVNSTIGQGYVLVNPTQLAVMASRLASGRIITPKFQFDRNRRPAPPIGVSQAHLDIIHNAMKDVVNRNGTARGAQMKVPGIVLAGKTGSAQVRRITMAERARGVRGDAALPFKLRDHALFIGYAPFDKPRYAVGCVLEHSHANGSAAGIASDTLSYLFDQQIAMDKLLKLEAGWGGTPAERREKQKEAYRAAHGLTPIAPAPADNASNAAEAAAAPAQDSAPAPAPAPAQAAVPPSAATNAVDERD